MNKLITVFSPVYNRAHCLVTLYGSLKRQTFKAFEWIVIDDGSTDHVDLLIEQWIQEKNAFSIRFTKTKNGGKVRAVNKAVQMALVLRN